MGNSSTSKTERIDSIEISILGIYLRKNIDHLGIKSSFHERNQCWMSFVQSPKSDFRICSMSNLVNVYNWFDIRCPFVQRQKYGIWVRLSNDEHVPVCSMFEITLKKWSLAGYDVYGLMWYSYKAIIFLDILKNFYLWKSEDM